MTLPLSLLLVDPNPDGLETLTYGFEREGANVSATSDLTAAPKLVDAATPALVVVALRAGASAGLDVIKRLRTGGHAIPHVALLALGQPEQQVAARAAGASGFLAVPAFIRDVVAACRLALVGRRAPGQAAPATESRLSDYGGVFYLLRAMAATDGSAVLRLERGNRRAELRVSEGRLVSANVASLQSLPALHHVLLWEEAALSVAVGAIPKRSQLNLSGQEVLDESERFLRDFAHAARDLGPSTTLYVRASELQAATVPGLQGSQVAPLLRLADGRRVLADLIAESPFRIFDTLRILKRLRDSGTLVARQPVADANHAGAKNGAARSMLGEWAMVPDQRGVVGNRRGPNRPQRPPTDPAGARTPLPGPATPLPGPATPLPLLNKKGVVRAGEIVPRRGPTPVADLSVAPTIQVKLDAAGVPLSAPQAPAGGAHPATGRAPGRPTPIQLRTKADLAARSELDRTPPPLVGRTDPGPQRRLDRTPPPRLDRRPPTGPQPRLDGRSPAGPQPRFDGRSPMAPQPRLDIRSPQSLDEHLERTPPPRVEAPTAVVLEPRLDGAPPPRMEPPIDMPPEPRLDVPPQPSPDVPPEARLDVAPQARLDLPPEAPVEVPLEARLDGALQPQVEAPVDVPPEPRLDEPPPVADDRRAEARSPAKRERPPSGPHAKVDRTPAPRVGSKTPVPQTAATAFDDVEADFFAREADLYKREALETFDDLDHPLDTKRPAKPRSRKK
jgi:DNA-binding response OmpR family regulator